MHRLEIVSNIAEADILSDVLDFAAQLSVVKKFVLYIDVYDLI